MFVFADSLVMPDKHNTGSINYNLRGVGCTPAAQSFARELGISELPKDAGPFGNSLRGLMDVYLAGKHGVSLRKMV
jgi:galactokinase